MGRSITKITEISQETRKIVLERQNNISPLGQWLGRGVEFHHVCTSGLGEKGVGYEWNVVALTPEEHRCITDHKPIFINGKQRYTYEEAITLIKNHLKMNYGKWSEDKCKVHKGWEEKDYGIKRITKR